MIIRPAKLSDVFVMARIVKGVKEVEDYPGEYAEKNLEKNIKNKDYQYLVVFEKTVVGFIECQIYLVEKRLVVHAVVVAKELRGKGVGQLLYAGAERLARKKGCTRISALVRDWNSPMKSFSEKLGYKHASTFLLYEKVLRSSQHG